MARSRTFATTYAKRRMSAGGSRKDGKARRLRKKRTAIRIYSMDDSMKLILGDCLKEMKKLPDDSVDLVLTDPPYNIADKNKLTKVGNEFKTNAEAWGKWDTMDSKQYFAWIKNIVQESYRILKNSGSFVSFFNKFNITYLRDMGLDAGFHPVNFYALVKRNPVPNLRKNGFTSGFELGIIFNKDKKSKKWNFLGQNQMQNYYLYSIGQKSTSHPTEKPISPMKRLIMIFTDKGDLVCDPFMGSGTTGAACKEMGRRFIGIEIDKEYFDIAKNRINNTQGSLF